MAIYSVYLTTLPTVGDGDPVNLAVDENGKLIVIAEGGLTDAELRATPVPVSGPLTDAEIRAAALPVAQVAADLVASATITATTTPAPLASQPCSSLLLQVDPDATEDVFFGSSAAQYMQLVPGSSILLRVSNADLIYVKTAANTAVVNTFTSA